MKRLQGFAQSLAIATLGVAVMLSTATAQTGERVREEIARTDEILDRAGMVVRESESLRARELLERAFQIQREARANLEGGRLLIAGRLTLDARAIANRAITIAREETGTGERAEREIERASRMLDQARDSLHDGPPPAIRLLSEAAALLERARATYREQQFNAALRLALASQRLVAQALAQGPAGLGHRLQRELERTDHALERLREAAAELQSAAAEMLGRAVALQDDAWTAFRDRHLDMASARTREARSLAHRIRSEMGPAIDEDTVAQSLRETQALLDRAADSIGPGDDERAAMLLERGVDHQARARVALEDGHLRAALAQTRVARNLAARAMERRDTRGID